MSDLSERVRVHTVEVLSDDWYVLKKTTFEFQRNDGTWQRQSRETYDRGNGATILLYNSRKRTVILTRQFRYPAFVNGYRNLLIETPALANFLLARAVARQREIATRLALGSSRVRIVRHSVVEALLLSLCGGLFGLVVAFEVTRALIAFVAQGATSTPLDPRPDPAILVFTFSISILTGLLFGLAPAMHVARAAASPGLIAHTRTAASGGGRGGRWWPKALVTIQITLCLLLLIGARLFVRTLRNLQDQDFGFERSHMLIADFDARIAGYEREQVPALNQRLLDRLAAIPGVRSVALAATPPISFGSWTSTLSISGYTPHFEGRHGDRAESSIGRLFRRGFDTQGCSCEPSVRSALFSQWQHHGAHVED